jgi:hypothetical protein
MANIEQKIEAAAQSIENYSRFLKYYIDLPCFTVSVNTIYNQEYSNNKIPKDKLDKPKVITAIRGIWNGNLTNIKENLKNCLRKNYSSEKSEEVSGNSMPNNEINLDPTLMDQGPFDRRLDRLAVMGNNDSIEVRPYNIAFRDSATTGLIESVDSINKSNSDEKEKFAEIAKSQKKTLEKDLHNVGVPSLINSYSITKLFGSEGGKLLIDQRGERKWYEVDSTNEGIQAYSKIPTTTSIINWGEGDPYGRTPYHFSDFVFCKHWNIIPNNRLLTLRRFPAPIIDNMKFPGMDGINNVGQQSSKSGEDNSNLNKPTDGMKTPQEDGGSGKKADFPPMATVLSYFGEETENQLSDILKFTTGFNWGDVEADVHEVSSTTTPEATTGPAGLFGGIGSLAKTLNIATGNYNREAVMNEGVLPPDPYTDGPYENRIIGPVNAITSVKRRERGIEFSNEISLTFEYVARPIGGVNSKAVLLDILSNFLIIGSAQAMFWGGQHRFMSNAAQYPFIGGDKGIQQWYRGQPLEWGQTSIEDFSSKSRDFGDLTKNFFSTLLGGGGFGEIFKNIASGEGGKKENVASNLIKHYAAQKSKGQIPYLQGLKALLIGEPVGEWHLTIGNPLNPIAMIGNLICKNIEVEFGNELGPDDFPMDIKITVNLEHGMARDRDAIQSMFNRGMGRIYELPDSLVGSADRETSVDNNTGNQSATGWNPTNWRFGAVLATGATTGGNTGPSANTENSLQGGLSVWNRNSFSAVSPNQDFSTPGANSAGNKKFNINSRSEFRSANWISIKTNK